MALTTLDPKPPLVVIDLQKGIVSSHTDPSIDDVVKQAANLATAFRRHGLPVVLVNDAMTDPDAAATQTASNASSPSLARPRPAPRSSASSTAGRAALTTPPADRSPRPTVARSTK